MDNTEQFLFISASSPYGVNNAGDYRNCEDKNKDKNIIMVHNNYYLLKKYLITVLINFFLGFILIILF